MSAHSILWQGIANEASNYIYLRYPSLSPHHNVPLLLIWSSECDGQTLEMLCGWATSDDAQGVYESLRSSLRRLNGLVTTACTLGALKSLLRLRPYKKCNPRHSIEPFSKYLDYVTGLQEEDTLTILEYMSWSLWWASDPRFRTSALSSILGLVNKYKTQDCPSGLEQIYWKYRCKAFSSHEEAVKGMASAGHLHSRYYCERVVPCE